MVHLGESDSFNLARINTIMVAAGTNSQTLENEGGGTQGMGYNRRMDPVE